MTIGSAKGQGEEVSDGLALLEGRCESCGEVFDLRFSRDKAHCFQCSVHEMCACADDPEPA